MFGMLLICTEAYEQPYDMYGSICTIIFETPKGRPIVRGEPQRLSIVPNVILIF